MAKLDLYIVIAYFIGSLGAGVWAERKATTQDQFLVAGRSVGPWLYAGTLAAIVVGGASTIGGVKLGYLYGISGMWFVFTFGLGILVLSLVFVERILGLNLYTVPELLERRYTESARVAGGVVMVAYSVLGGMWSLTLTDIIQFIIKTVGVLFILLPGAILHAGGLSAMQARLPAGFFSPTHIGGAKIGSFFILYFFGIIIGQDVWQRVFTARSVRVARNGGIAVGFYCLCYALAGALIGAAGRVFLPPLTDPDSAFAAIVNAVLPVGMRGLLLAAALAAIMSTASACLLAASTVLLEDVYLPLRRQSIKGSVGQSRAVTLVLGVFMTALACLMHDVIAAITVAYDLLVGGLLVPIIGAMMWKRGTTRGAFASIAIGIVTVVVSLMVCGLDSDVPIYVGLGLSLAAYFGFSLGSGRAPTNAATNGGI